MVEITRIITLAPDRIVNITYDLAVDYLKKDLDGDSYYENTIGVRVMNNNSLYDIVLKFDRLNIPYVVTKPFHHSQEKTEILQGWKCNF